MASFSKKFVTSFFRDSVNTQSRPAGAASLVRPLSIVRLFESPLKEVNIIPGDEPNFNNYTVININPYTLEEQLIMYPVVVVHSSPAGCPYTVIDVE